MTTLSPFSILLRVVEQNYEKLTAAREIFEVISNRMTVLDHPQELIAFLVQHLKPKEVEKKQNGEVFTPPDLIQQKFDQLTLADPSIWSDPSKKFLDPANGIGNYPALAYHRLMTGLAEAIPNEADRKRHILENMLYMCELTKKNVEVSRKLFDPTGMYALRLFQGSYLDLDPMAEWGVEKFDVIFGNPPYQPSSNGKKGGKSLWPIFVKRSMTQLQDRGFLVFVHPSLWRKPENELHDLMFGKQFHYLSIHSSQEGSKMFQAATRFDWYILQHTPSVSPTRVRFDDGSESMLMIQPSLPFIMNHGNDVIEKMRHRPVEFLKTEMMMEGHLQKRYISKVKLDSHPFPIVNSSSDRHGINLAWSSKALSHQYAPKVIFSNGGVVQPFYDPGRFGTTQGGIYIGVSSEKEGRHIVRYLKSTLLSYLVAASKWSNFETNKQIFWSIPHPRELPEQFTDEQVYAYFGLTPEEVSRIEADQPKGLADYVALEAPQVSVPAQELAEELVEEPAEEHAQEEQADEETDYHHMKVADLRALCKARNIRGHSGKNKEALIAMLA